MDTALTWDFGTVLYGLVLPAAMLVTALSALLLIKKQSWLAKTGLVILALLSLGVAGDTLLQLTTSCRSIL